MKLYVYEHCQYCVRPRLVADIKKIPLELIFLANDDERAHYDLVGKKLVPILKKADGSCLLESLDICNYLDKLTPDIKLAKTTQSDILTKLLDDVSSLSRELIYPRTIYHPMNKKDFPTLSAQLYFKATKEKINNRTFDDSLAQSKQFSLPLLEKLNEIATTMKHQYISGDKFSYHDVITFPNLRRLTVAQDVLTIPDKIMQYLTLISEQTHIELYPEFDFSQSLKI